MPPKVFGIGPFNRKHKSHLRRAQLVGDCSSPLFISQVFSHDFGNKVFAISSCHVSLFFLHQLAWHYRARLQMKLVLPVKNKDFLCLSRHHTLKVLISAADRQEKPLLVNVTVGAAPEDYAATIAAESLLRAKLIHWINSKTFCKYETVGQPNI